MKPRALLIGCGTNRQRQVRKSDQSENLIDGVVELITLDMNPDIGADVIWDMEVLPLPFDDCSFSELHAYNCLEHFGRQGDWRGFFAEFAEYHRILKQGGTFGIVVPLGGDAFADPGHTRFFSTNHFGFLNQDFYESNYVKGTCFTDYRWYWRLDFKIQHMHKDEAHIYVLLEKA